MVTWKSENKAPTILMCLPLLTRLITLQSSTLDSIITMFISNTASARPLGLLNQLKKIPELERIWYYYSIRGLKKCTGALNNVDSNFQLMNIKGHSMAHPSLPETYICDFSSRLNWICVELDLIGDPSIWVGGWGNLFVTATDEAWELPWLGNGYLKHGCSSHQAKEVIC